MQDWTQRVLDFWFGELTEDDWFSGAPEIDEKIRARFGDLCAIRLEAGDEQPDATPREALASILVLDQFPRNLYRRTPQAFAGDAAASAIARRAVAAGFDTALSPQERQFLYMPLMHSEVLADQEHCVSLFRALGDENALKYAIEHRDIVAKFGRFPHRNRALDRESTAEERAFLGSHEGFGQ